MTAETQTAPRVDPSRVPADVSDALTTLALLVGLTIRQVEEIPTWTDVAAILIFKGDELRAAVTKLETVP